LVTESGRTETKATIQQIESDVQRLQRTLESVIIAEPPVDKGKVALGASVLIRDRTGEEETYQIVGIDEAEPDEGRISSASPLARALLNGRAGDKVHFKSPAGEQELTILVVHY
jgi:transcription elongation factor GreB